MIRHAFDPDAQLRPNRSVTVIMAVRWNYGKKQLKEQGINRTSAHGTEWTNHNNIINRRVGEPKGKSKNLQQPAQLEW
jgi:hypothetical protein